MELNELEPLTLEITELIDHGDSGNSGINDNGPGTDKEISWKTDEFHKVKGY